MKIGVTVLGALLCSTASAMLMAEEQVETAPMLCAVTSTVSCDSAGDCLEGPASAVNLPIFIKFDPQNKVLESARQGGERRTSKIEYFASTDDTIVLLGDDVNEGWSATVDKATGSLTATVSTQGMGYIIFGSCLAL